MVVTGVVEPALTVRGQIRPQLLGTGEEFLSVLAVARGPQPGSQGAEPHPESAVLSRRPALTSSCVRRVGPGPSWPAVEIRSSLDAAVTECDAEAPPHSRR